MEIGDGEIVIWNLGVGGFGRGGLDSGVFFFVAATGACPGGAAAALDEGGRIGNC